MAPTVIIKTANAPCDVRDVRVDCDNTETVAALKSRITSCHPLKPASTDQRLIFKGVCLRDAQVLKDIVRDNEDAVFHLALRAGAMSPVSSTSGVQHNSNSGGSSRVRSASPRALRRRRQLPSRQTSTGITVAQEQQQQQRGGSARDTYTAHWWPRAAPMAAGSGTPASPQHAAAAWTNPQDAAAAQYYAAWYRYYYGMSPYHHMPGPYASQTTPAAATATATTAASGSHHAFLQPYRPSTERLDHHVQRQQQTTRERPDHDTAQLPPGASQHAHQQGAANNADGNTNLEVNNNNNNNNNTNHNIEGGVGADHADHDGNGEGGEGGEDAAQRFAQAGAGAARAPDDNDQAVGNDGRVVRRGPVDMIWWFLKTAALLILMGGNDPGRRVYSLVVAFSLIALHYFGAFQAIAAWIVRLQQQAEEDRAQEAQRGDEQADTPVEPAARPSLAGEIATIFVTFFTSMLPLELMREHTIMQEQQQQQQQQQQQPQEGGGEDVAAPQNNEGPNEENDNNNNDNVNEEHGQPGEVPAEVAARA